MVAGIKPTELTPDENRTLTSLRKLINSSSINRSSIDVKITDNLEMIPWWNIIARIWNRSHLDRSDVQKNLLKAVKNTKILNQLSQKELGTLHTKLQCIYIKFMKNLIKGSDRKKDLVENYKNTEAAVLEKYHKIP
jgi:hypothetical protein